VLRAAEFRKFLVFCVVQGSGVTPVKCSEKYDIDFVENFTENATV